MGVSGIIAIVSLVFSVSHGSISLILAWRKDRKNDKNSTDNVEILRNKNEILATDSKNKAEHFKNEEKLSEQSIATLEKLTQTVTKLLERDSAPQMIDESKKRINRHWWWAPSIWTIVQFRQRRIGWMKWKKQFNLVLTNIF